jgi:hypothetical protein
VDRHVRDGQLQTMLNLLAHLKVANGWLASDSCLFNGEHQLLAWEVGMP